MNETLIPKFKNEAQLHIVFFQLVMVPWFSMFVSSNSNKSCVSNMAPQTQVPKGCNCFHSKTLKLFFSPYCVSICSETESDKQQPIQKERVELTVLGVYGSNSFSPTLGCSLPFWFRVTVTCLGWCYSRVVLMKQCCFHYATEPGYTWKIEGRGWENTQEPSANMEVQWSTQGKAGVSFSLEPNCSAPINLVLPVATPLFCMGLVAVSSQRLKRRN